MQCIFCHKDSSTSKSVEHIIPESLGNKEHILPKGYVCDACNHYFSVKIESQLLSQPYFVSMRRRNDIRTKKGRYVAEEMFFPGAHKMSETRFDLDENVLYITDQDVIQSIVEGKCHSALSLYLEEPEFPNKVMSRFLAKCAYESIFLLGGDRDYQLWLKGRENNDCTFQYFEELRQFARYGVGEWSYSQRRIYSEGTFFSYKGGEPYEVLHEQKFFYRGIEWIDEYRFKAELYYVLVVCGIEYVICVTDPDISGYHQWLKEHPGHSPIEDENETRLEIGMYDVNPLLIKFDDKAETNGKAPLGKACNT